MLSPVYLSELQAGLRAQLAGTERRIAVLIAIRDGLDRLLIESKILEALAIAKGKPLPTRGLFARARAANPKLKYNTFRSHLTRLKERGQVVADARARGFWKLP